MQPLMPPLQTPLAANAMLPASVPPPLLRLRTWKHNTRGVQQEQMRSYKPRAQSVAALTS